MSEEMKLPAELRELEQAAAGVVPSGAGRGSGGLDRDAVMFEAGRSVGKGRARLWQGLCGALLAACVGLALVPRAGAGRSQSENFAVTPAVHGQGIAPAVALAELPMFRSESPEVGTTMVYWRLRERLLLQGMSALPVSGEAGGASAPALRPGDGLEAIPRWQRRAELGTGDQS